MSGAGFWKDAVVLGGCASILHLALFAGWVCGAARCAWCGGVATTVGWYLIYMRTATAPASLKTSRREVPPRCVKGFVPAVEEDGAGVTSCGTAC